jgi:integrase
VAAAKLHAQNIHKLPAIGGQRTDYTDTELAGLQLRVSPTGARSFAVVYHVWLGAERVKRRFLLGPTPPVTLAAARAEAKLVLSRVALGADPHAERVAERKRPEGLTFRELTKKCLADVALKPSTRRDYERMAKKEIYPAIGDRAAGDVARADVRALVAGIKKRGAGYVANRTFALVRRVFNWACDADLVPASPCAGLRRPAEERESERVLSVDELRALMAALADMPGKHSDVVWLLLLTVARENMIVGLRRCEPQQLDEPANARLVFAGGAHGRTKNKHPFIVPLVKPAVDLVEARLKATTSGEYLFPQSGHHARADRPMWWGSEYAAALFDKVDEIFRKNAGAPARRKKDPRIVPAWTVHNLRHTIVTHMREDLGVREDVCSALLGHTPTGIGVAKATKIYLRAQLLPERRAALQAWSTRLEEIARGSVEKGKVLAGPWRGPGA